MVKMRNQYLAKVQTNDWVVVHDPDEVFNEGFCSNVRGLCHKAKQQGIVLLLINSHDTTFQSDGSEDSSVSDFFKNLIYRKAAGTYYEGVGEVKEVHETLIIPGTVTTVQLPKEKYWYQHVKYWHEVWERACRNVFLGGGGNNAGTRNPSWKPLRDLCDRLGLNTWPKTRDYLRKGDIDMELKEWFLDNNCEGWDFDHEEMEAGRWYFEFLHPEEATLPDGRSWKPVFEIPKGHPAEVMRYVEDTYMQVLGRHAEQEGKEAYVKAIVDGTLKREDLPQILKQSPEYTQKVAPPGESMRLNIPVSVDLKLSEDLIVQALMRSTTFWEKIKPRLDIGKYLEDQVEEVQWAELQRWFYAEHPTLKAFAKKLGELSHA